MTVFLAILSIAAYAGLIQTTIPPQCLANFRWDDCGSPPQPVMYYWRVASRCEVGIWRGCLPNMNMFKDEYECVSTCTFSVRASDQDFHGLLGTEDDFTTPNYDDNTEFDNNTYATDMSTTPAEDITTEATVEGDEKKDENEKDEDNKEEGADDKKDEEEKKDGDEAATENEKPEGDPEGNPEDNPEGEPEDNPEAEPEE